jgi:hypothetical protein
MSLYYGPSLKLMNALSEQLQVKAHEDHSEEAKEVHVSVIFHEKITFVVTGFEHRISHIQLSDAPTQPNCSHNLKMYHSSWYISTKT